MLATALTTLALLPGVLTPTVAEVKQQTTIPILLPSSLESSSEELFGNGIGDASMYRIQLTTTADCDANFCSVAWFTGERGIALRGGKAVKLAKGRKGRYKPMSCGASCSPASIAWKDRGVVYGIQTGKSRAVLVKLANAAIKQGPR